MGRELLVRVVYPLREGASMVLVTDTDWNRRVEPASVTGNQTFEFRLDVDRDYLYFKPCIVDGDALLWAQGENYLAVTDVAEQDDVYPHFFSERPGQGTIAGPVDFADASGTHRVRVYLPPGYDENTLKRYPVLYMHDGQNLFFPDESFLGQTWQVQDTLQVLDAMCFIEELIVVGIYPNDRMREYTRPGYESYARFLVETLKPRIDGGFRTLPGPESTAVMGSSLGGVVSMFLGWQRPDVFGMAGCLSSTFGYADDLVARIAREPRRNVRFYLDSGWPGDNYEATRSMRDVLLSRGYRQGVDLLYYALPDAIHSETSWAARFHLPIEFFFGDAPRFLAG